jgi:Carboxypeptidase regulatory-like domain/TonB dependent receptor/TonB-dependent Receptor Plug Domain
VRTIGLFLILSLASATICSAQSPSGTISGIVFDPSGGIVAGADILIVSDTTSVQYPAKTDGEGIYLVANLPPGPYRIQVSKIGFKTIIKPDIVIHVQDALAINFRLPLGAVSEIVTVQGGTPLVNTESGSVSTVIDRQFVENLPMNGRSFNTLLQLTPGVVIAPSSIQSPGQFSIAGQRTSANNFTVDGVSADFGVQAGITAGGGSGLGQAQAFSALGGTSSLVSADDLQEFRIETSSFDAEFGRQPGGQVLLTTRSGTNDWHGGVFDYFRNTVMDANDWFANNAGLGRAAEHHNDFGGFVGGPILKGRTFFFVSYEGARLRLPTTLIDQVPSVSARESAPAALAPFLNAYPIPNGPISSDGFTAQYAGGFSNSGTLNATSIRIDHFFSSRFSIFGRYNYAPSKFVSLSSPGELDTLPVNTQTLTLGANMEWGGRFSNALRGNYSTQTSNVQSSLHAMGGAVLPPASLYLGDLSPTSNELNFQTFDTYYFAAGSVGHNQSKQLNFTDDLTWTVAGHALKLGGDGRLVYLHIAPSMGVVGYSTDTVQDFLATGQADLYTTTTLPAKILAKAFSLYAQDTWHVNARLTLSYGLRWEVSPAPSAQANTMLVAWENLNNPAAITPAPAGTPLWSTKYANFAPRIGLAYRLNSKGDFVVRGGAGVFYDLGLGSASIVPSYWPNSAAGSFLGVSVPVASVSPYLPAISLAPPYPDQIFAFTPELGLPRSYQWNVALEKSFGGNQTVSVTYLGQAGRDLLREEALYQPNPNFSGLLYITRNNAFSNYDALQVQYRRPLAKSVQALLNYSYSHSLDNASNDVVAGLSNAVISAASDYASSDFDARHSFSGAVTWQIPSTKRDAILSAITRNWSLATIVVARSGFPFNAHVYLGASVLTEQYTRPDLVAGQPLWIPTGGAPGGKTLNPNAFAIPPTVRQGTEGRNDIPGFGLTQADLSVGREFSIGERMHLQFRADAFNALNHPNFTNPVGYIQFGPLYYQSTSMLNQGLGGLNPLFQSGGPRSLQLSLKLIF